MKYVKITTEDTLAHDAYLVKRPGDNREVTEVTHPKNVRLHICLFMLPIELCYTTGHCISNRIRGMNERQPNRDDTYGCAIL